MKVDTKNALIEIAAENEIEVSFLCLWEAEARRILEDEGVSLDLLNNLLSIRIYLDEDVN